MFYVISQTDTQSQNQSVIVISELPATENLSGRPRENGWCGTTNNISIIAEGAYADIDEARQMISVLLKGEYHDTDTQGNPYESDDDGVIEVYKKGKYPVMTKDAFIAYAQESLSNMDKLPEDPYELFSVLRSEVNDMQLDILQDDHFELMLESVMNR